MYVVCIIYMAICVFVIHLGDEMTIRNTFFSNIVLLFLLPGSLISIVLGFWGGVTGEILGIIITIMLIVITVERIYKRASSENKQGS